MTGQIKIQRENLEKWMEANGWSRQQFAESLSVTPEFISLLLNGKRFPSISTLENICEVTGLDVGRLIFFEREIVK